MSIVAMNIKIAIGKYTGRNGFFNASFSFFQLDLGFWLGIVQQWHAVHEPSALANRLKSPVSEKLFKRMNENARKKQHTNRYSRFVLVLEVRICCA